LIISENKDLDPNYKRE
jgi:hypothetical protein